MLSTNRVREVRNRFGLTQEELADAAGINKITVLNVERGKSKPNYDTMRAILAVFRAKEAEFPPSVQEKWTANSVFHIDEDLTAEGMERSGSHDDR